MTSNQPSAEMDRQRQQHQKAWIWVLAVGCALIIVGNVMVGKLELDHTTVGWSLAVVLALLMILYGHTARKASQVSSDTMGEAFYYLGLLFTFASLVAALINFSIAQEGADVTGMIGPFGIALLTTIVGLSGRVVFSVWQEAPGDAVAGATRSLDEAIREMKAIVGLGADSMRDLVDNLGTSARAMKTTAKRMEGVLEKAADTTDTLDKYSSTVTQLAQSFTDGAEEFSRAVTVASKSVSVLHDPLKEAGNSLLALNKAIKQAQETVAKLDHAGGEGERQLEGVASRAEKVQEEMAKMQAGFARTAEFFAGAERAGSAIDGHATRIGSSVGSLEGEVAKLREAAGRAAEAVSGTAPQIEDAGSRMKGVASQADSLNKSMSELADATARGREAVSSRVEDLLDGLRADLLVLSKAIEQAGGTVEQLGRAGREGERQIAGVASQAEGVQEEMTKMQAGFAKTAEFFSDAQRTGSAIDDYAARIGSSVGGLGDEVAKLQEAAARAAEAVSGTAPQIEDAGSRMRGVASQADSLSRSMSELSDATAKGREAVSSRVEELEESLTVAGTKAERMISRAGNRAESVASDLDGLRDQLTETHKQLSQVTPDRVAAGELQRRNAAAARAKGRKGKWFLFWRRGSDQ